MQNKQRNLLIAGVVVVSLGITALFVLTAQHYANQQKEEPYYVKDEETGLDFFVDPNQAPETEGNEGVITLLNTTTLYSYFTNTEFEKIRYEIAIYAESKQLDTKRARITNSGEVKTTDNGDITFSVSFDDTTVVTTAVITYTDPFTLKVTFTP